MRVINEHECKYLKNQNSSEKDFIAIQEMIQDTDKEEKYSGWYMVNYLYLNTKKEQNLAYGIRYCPYCGELLRKD